MPDTSDTYVKGWDASTVTGARRSPARVVPLLMELVGPASVVDFGCGLGAWLQEFSEHGASDVLGIEGSWIDEATEGTRGAHLEVPRERLLVHDLARPIELDRRFDLAMSLEVAEHLPPEAGPELVRSITRAAPVVLFSAAVPFQGGTGHVNERWPSYWVERFAEQGFEVIDCLRPRLWNDDGVAWYYRQNMLLFASPEGLEAHEALRRERDRVAPGALDVVHPERFLSLGRHSPVRLYELARGELRSRAPGLARTLGTIKRAGRR